MRVSESRDCLQAMPSRSILEQASAWSIENWQTPLAYGHSPYLRGRVICTHSNSSPKLGEVPKGRRGL